MRFSVWSLAFVNLAVATLNPRRMVNRVQAFKVCIYNQEAAGAEEPCKVLSDAYDASNSSDDGAVLVSISPSTGIQCLKSVPVDKSSDLALLQYLDPYIGFQSTIEILADPPMGYLMPGVDILGGLGKIKDKLEKDGYDSQYNVMLDLQSIFLDACDNHFNYPPALLNTIAFSRKDLNLVSISEDGLKVPEIYLRTDVNPETVDDLTFEPSPIQSIDGTNITDFLEQDAVFNIANYQDPDAQFNALFTSIPGVAAGQTGTIVFSSFEIPDNYTVTFKNGSTLIIQNQVLFLPGVNFTGIDNGEDFHQAFEVPPSSTASQAPSETASSAAVAAPSATTQPEPGSATVPGYPYPVVKESTGALAGYFLNDTGFADVAILAILSFLPLGAGNDDLDRDQEVEFLEDCRAVFVKLVKEAKKAGRDKLVIDLSANGGGSVELAIEIYRLLFPDGVMTTFDRMRATKSLGAASEADYPAVVGTILDDDDFPLDDKGDAIEVGKVFYGPYLVKGQNVTDAFVDDISKPFGDHKKFYLNGFDPNNSPVIAKAPFKPENMLIITDGTCASSCNILTGLLTRTYGIKTLALGGRPLELPMQAMGGTKGTELNTFSEFQQAFVQINNSASDSRHAENVLNDAASAIPSPEDAPLLPFLQDSSAAACNSHSGYFIDDLEGYPLQFRYEAAHCRLFYTAAMVSNVTETWRRVADVAWRNGTCVPGSTVNEDGTIGNTTVEYDDRVRSRAKPMPGPGVLQSNSSSNSSSAEPTNSTSSNTTDPSNDGSKSMAAQHPKSTLATVVFLAALVFGLY